MENYNDIEMKEMILKKLGIDDMDEYNKMTPDIPHEKDNVPNPFDRLSLEELDYLCEHNYFLSKKI